MTAWRASLAVMGTVVAATGCGAGSAAAPLADAGVADGPHTDARVADAARSDAAAPPDAPAHRGRFWRPEAFDRSDCATSGFAAAALRGIWRVEHVEATVPGTGWTLHLSADGAGQSALLEGEPVVLQRDDGAILVHQAQSATSELAFLVCRVDAGGAALDAKLGVCAGHSCTQGHARLTRLDRLEPETSRGVRALGHFDFRTQTASPFDHVLANVRVAGTHAYVVGWSSFRVLDVGNPQRIAEVAYLPGNWNDIKLATLAGRPYAILAGQGGITVVDIADPRSPTILATASRENQFGHSLFIQGDLVVSTNGVGVTLWRLTDPKLPAYLGEFLLPPGVPSVGQSFVHDLWIDGDRMYLAHWGSGLVVADISSPERPRYLGSFQYPMAASHSVIVTHIGDRTIALEGGEAIGAHLRVLDVTDPTRIEQLGELSLRRPVTIHNFLVVGSRLHVAWFQDGYRGVDLTDLTHPKVEAFYNTYDPDAADGTWFYEGAIGIDVPAGDLTGKVYLLDDQTGLWILQP